MLCFDMCVIQPLGRKYAYAYFQIQSNIHIFRTSRLFISLKSITHKYFLNDSNIFVSESIKYSYFQSLSKSMMDTAPSGNVYSGGQDKDKDMYKCKLTMDLTYNLMLKFDFILYLFYWLLKSVGVFAWDTNSFQFLVVDFNQAYVRMCQVKRRHFFYSRISLYFLLTLEFCTKIKIKI